MFTDTGLPALYCFRDGGHPPVSDAHEWRRTHDTVSLLWVFPVQAQTVAKLRSPIIAAITKTLDRGFYQNRDPAYVQAGDPDPSAPTFTEQLDAFLLTKTTSTSPVSYSGAGLDGANAGQPIAPSRGIVVNLGGPPSSWVDGSHIILTGTDVLDRVTSIPLVVTVAHLPGKLYSPSAMNSLTGIQIDAQAGTAGTIQVGTGARAGYGSNIVILGGFDIELTTTATWRPLRIPLAGSNQVRAYPAIRWQLTIPERLVIDPADSPLAGAGIDQFGQPATGPGTTITITTSDGSYVTAVGSFP